MAFCDNGGAWSPRILAAAIKLVDGRVLSVPQPARHPSVILLAQKERLSLSGSTQGFITSEGRFVDRLEAFKIAGAAGQLLPGWEKLSGQWLYSEDVW